MNNPYGLVAELTYRCPLHCPYCSNPLELAAHRDELTVQEWLRVLDEARALGVLQLHLTGGEPLQYIGISPIIKRARELGLYTNLITSAISLTQARAEAFKEAGLDHVQISIQAADPERSDRLAGTRSFHLKMEAARIVKALGFPLTINVVLHRQNLDQLDALIRLAENLGADWLELANTQYYGWALLNRPALLPTREQLKQSEEIVAAARARLGQRMQIVYVVPDYYAEYPKPCMGGWAKTQFTVTPGGNVLPCHAAGQITTLPIENVRQRSLSWIWQESPMFNAFRGDSWMPEPCRSCPRKTVDFGGCRCQALQLTGNAAATDPVCHLSPQHSLIANAVSENPQSTDDLPDLIYRGVEEWMLIRSTHS